VLLQALSQFFLHAVYNTPRYSKYGDKPLLVNPLLYIVLPNEYGEHVYKKGNMFGKKCFE
jgi:hypothetical protein